MKDALARPIYLNEYSPSDYLIDFTELCITLDSKITTVAAKLSVKKNPIASTVAGAPALVLDGSSNIELRSIKLDGEELGADRYLRETETLTIWGVKDSSVIETIVVIEPEKNTSLNGLYKSRKMYCTQCEAEGFREITFYLDRPDVLSEFTTTIIADKADYPVLLSNGNQISRKDLENGKHMVTWHDPFKKPSYLFALVAGDLSVVEDEYLTCGGRLVALKIFVEAKDVDKCSHAMVSLKKAMRWDEETYGREYDLDIFMIVAVDDFNMGAMENKGLNIFNTSCVLANPDISRDVDFQQIEAIVAHEYFHNWSGNRVTCRDWFQLSLKEGFTVFRDAQFSADMNFPIVKRIQDAAYIRTYQFAEDASPMSHPVQPDSYVEINNFYTLTVYEKGAEIVGMLHTLLGKEVFRHGTDLYFNRHDGQAVTIEEFVMAMEDVSGRDLTQFRLWYKQSGTPEVEVKSDYSPDNRELTLAFNQHCPDTPNQADKQPFLIPIRLGFLDEKGNSVKLSSTGENESIIEITESAQEVVFKGVDANCVPSLLRRFSAPIKISYPYSISELAHLMKHDSDGFNRWDAGQKLATKILQLQVSNFIHTKPFEIHEELIGAYHELVLDPTIDDAVLALMLQLPGEAALAEASDPTDPIAIYKAREFVRHVIASELERPLEDIYLRSKQVERYTPHKSQIGRRSLKNTALDYLMLTGSGIDLAWRQFEEADNMTDMAAALSALTNCPDAKDYAEQALEQFEGRWNDEALAMNLWFSIQAKNPQDGGLKRVTSLLNHPLFSMKNPNKVRSVLGTYCQHNLINFHQPEGGGYEFLADKVLELNEINPQIGARLVTPLARWRKYASPHNLLMLGALKRIDAHSGLAKDIREIVSKSL